MKIFQGSLDYRSQFQQLPRFQSKAISSNYIKLTAISSNHIKLTASASSSVYEKGLRIDPSRFEVPLTRPVGHRD
jgi:hypothetical protein